MHKKMCLKLYLLPLRVITIITIITFITGQISRAALSDKIVPGDSVSSSRPSNVSIDYNSGKVVKKYSGNTKKQVFFIQDIHCNYNAQKKIAMIIASLHKNHQVRLVGLEGAYGSVKPTLLAAIPDEKIRLKTLDYLLREGVITGAELCAASAYSDYVLAGVENKTFYEQNYHQFTNTLTGQEDSIRLIEQLQETLDLIKEVIYHAEITEINQKYASFQQGTLDVSVFLKILIEQATAININWHEYQNIVLLKEFYDHAGSISAEQIQRECEN